MKIHHFESWANQVTQGGFSRFPGWRMIQFYEQNTIGGPKKMVTPFFFHRKYASSFVMLVD